VPDRPVIRFGGQTQVDRPVVQFDRGPGAQRPVIRFGQPGVGAEPDKLDKGDFLPNLVGGLVRSFTSLPAVAVHAVTTPPERQALEVLQGMYEIGKGYYNIPRAYGNLVVGDFTPSAPGGVAAPPGFVMVQDFGGGVVLFRRHPR